MDTAVQSNCIAAVVSGFIGSLRFKTAVLCSTAVTLFVCSMNQRPHHRLRRLGLAADGALTPGKVDAAHDAALPAGHGHVTELNSAVEDAWSGIWAVT